MTAPSAADTVDVIRLLRQDLEEPRHTLSRTPRRRACRTPNGPKNIRS